MSHKLVSFLGRGPYQPNGARENYRSTSYRFEDFRSNGSSWTSPSSKHFAYAAYQLHRQPGMTPFDAVVILGTPGSMWDALADSFGTLGDQGVSEIGLAISELVDLHAVSQELLDRFAVELSIATRCDVQLRLIPSSADAASQSEILNQITAAICDGDGVYLDVTHGYRHLPMIGLAAASVSANLKRARITEINYGALEMTREGVTPVISLHWILQLFDVLNGMNEFSRRQSLRPLIECFPHGQIRTALEDAAYKLDVMRIDEAATKVRECLQLFDQQNENLPVDLRLIGQVLRSRLEQFSQQQRTLKGLTNMARLALDEDDFLKTSVFLAEACQLAFDQGIPGDGDQDRKLKAVRNWLAHAGKLEIPKEDRDVREWVANRNQLRQFLRDHIERLWRDAKLA